MLASKKKPKDTTKPVQQYELPDIKYKQPIDAAAYPDWSEGDKYKYMRFYVTDKCIVYLVYYKHSMDCKTFMCVWETRAGEQASKEFDSIPFVNAYDIMLTFVDSKQREPIKTIAR